MAMSLHYSYCLSKSDSLANFRHSVVPRFQMERLSIKLQERMISMECRVGGVLGRVEERELFLNEEFLWQRAGGKKFEDIEEG